MKQSLYLKTLIFLTVPLLISGFSFANGEELKCETIFKTKELKQAFSKSLNTESFPLWIDRRNNRYEVITLSTDGKNCNLDMKSIVAEGKYIPLSKLGYYDDIYIEGSNPYFQIYFPVYKTFISGKAVFNIEISPIAKEDSIISVKINDKIVKLLKLKEFGYIGKIEIPLQDFKNRKFVKISIEGDIKVGRTICDDINAKNIYIKINPYNSGFYVLKDTKERDIKTFFFDYSKSFYIDKLDIKSLKFFYYIPSATNWIKADVDILKDINIPKKIINSEDKGSFTQVEKLSKGFLLTTGNPDIVSNFILKSTLVSEINNSDVNQNQERLSKNVITLKELGISNLTLSGVGVLSFYIPFNTARLGGLPDKLQFNMFISNSAIDEHDRAFLEVFVNDSLVKSYQLKDISTERKGLIIDIPKSLLGAGLNNILVKVSYYPSSDRCIGATPNITVSLDNNSYFKWSETIKNVSKVRDFLNMVNGKVAVVVDGKPVLNSASYLLEILGKINPNISKLDIYSKLSELSPSQYDYIIMFLNNKTAQKVLNNRNVPLRVDNKGFSIFNIQTGKQLFRLGSNESIGFMEVIDYEGKTTLVVSYINSPDMLKGIKLFNPVNINSLLGNLVLFNSNDYSIYNIGDYINIEYVSEKGLFYYWNNYKVVIISILAGIVILFEIFVIRKLVKTKRKKQGR